MANADAHVFLRVGVEVNTIAPPIYWGAELRANPAALAAQAVAEEEARQAAALKKLLNDREYEDLKADLEGHKAR